MVDSIMVPVKGSNCQEDVDTFLVGLKEKKAEALVVPAQTPEEQLMENVPAEAASIISVCTMPTYDEDVLSLMEQNVLAYIAGYIVKKLKDKICVECKNKICGEIDPDNQFLSQKNYSEARHGLMAPSGELLENVQSLEDVFREIVETTAPKLNVKKTLVCTLQKRVSELQQFNCEKCHLHLLILHLFNNIRFHFYLKKNNESIAQSNKRKNRKTLKFAHL